MSNNDLLVESLAAIKKVDTDIELLSTKIEGWAATLNADLEAVNAHMEGQSEARDPRTVSPAILELGVPFDFRKIAQQYIDDRPDQDVTGHRANQAMATMPNRLLYYSDVEENTATEIALLFHNADLLEQEEHAFLFLHFRGYPIVKLQDLAGLTIPEIMVVAPVNRKVARGGGRISKADAEFKAAKWASGVIHTAHMRDQAEVTNKAAAKADQAERRSSIP